MQEEGLIPGGIVQLHVVKIIIFFSNYYYLQCSIIVIIQ